MTNHRTAGFWPRLWTSVLAAILIATGALFATASPASADTACPDSNACFWPLQNFQGNKVVRGNAGEGIWQPVNGGQFYHSLKNRFSNRALLTAKAGQPASCTPAGNNRETAPEFNFYLVLGAGSHC